MQLLVLMLSQGLHIQDRTVTQLINDKDLNFLLYDVFKLEALTDLERYQDHDKIPLIAFWKRQKASRPIILRRIMPRLIITNRVLMANR